MEAALVRVIKRGAQLAAPAKADKVTAFATHVHHKIERCQADSQGRANAGKRWTGLILCIMDSKERS